MADLVALAEAEYEYLRARRGRESFLALSRYTTTLWSKRRLRRIIAKLESEMKAALERFVGEQNAMIEDARAIRLELAERAPEIDNSDMEEPDHGSPTRWRYDLDSFANFDRLADADHGIGYPVVPKDDDDPGPVSRLVQILRGRFKAATEGEDAGLDAPQIRNDLDDLARRIGNLGERQRESVQRFRLESRTLPGIAWVRLSYFGSDLVAEATQIESDDDIEQSLDRSFREWGQPKTIVRKLVNGERLSDWEQRLSEETQATLESEAERFHRELAARLTTGRRSLATFIREEPLVVAIVGGVIAGIILWLLLGT